MEFVQVFALVSLILLLGMFVVLGLFLRRTYLTKRVRVMVISKDGNLETKRFKNISSTFTIGEEEYVFDPKFQVKRKFWNEIYYLKGIPNPIDWFNIEKESVENLKVGKMYISGQNLKNIIRGRLFDDIVRKDNTTPIFVFILILGVLVLINLYLTFKQGQGVAIADIPANKDLIIRWITGG